MTSRAPRIPIRFSLRTYTPEEIDALNSELGLTGRAAFQPAEALLRDIEAGVLPTRASDPLWQYHPDERVQLALLSRKDLVPNFRTGPAPLLDIAAIWATAYAQATYEGVVWTPVLDYLSGERRHWPGRSVEEHLASQQFVTHVPERVRRSVTYRSEGQQAELLRDWIRDGGDERLELLLRAGSDSFVSFALFCVRDLSPVVLRRILDQRPSLGPVLIDGVGQPWKRLMKVFKDWALDDMLLLEERLRSLPENASALEKLRLAYGANTLVWVARAEASEEGRNLTLAEIERLLSLAAVKDSPVTGVSGAAVRVLLAYVECLNEEQLLRLLPCLSLQSSEVAIVAANATHATPRVWQACIERSPIDEVYETVAQKEQALRTPEIRARLEQSDNIEVLTALSQTATGEEFKRVFRKLVRSQPLAAAAVLRNQPECARFLTRGDLLPLMESADHADRLLAITLSSSAMAEDVEVTSGQKREGRERG